MKRKNTERAAKARARNFTGAANGREPKDSWIRSFPCVGCGGWPTVAAHAIPRQMGACGGDASTLVPLCHRCHRESGERGTSARSMFEIRRGLLVDGEAPGVALIRIAGELDERWRSGEDSYGAPF